MCVAGKAYRNVMVQANMYFPAYRPVMEALMYMHETCDIPFAGLPRRGRGVRTLWKALGRASSVMPVMPAAWGHWHWQSFWHVSVPSRGSDFR